MTRFQKIGIYALAATALLLALLVVIPLRDHALTLQHQQAELRNTSQLVHKLESAATVGMNTSAHTSLAKAYTTAWKQFHLPGSLVVCTGKVYGKHKVPADRTFALVHGGAVVVFVASSGYNAGVSVVGSESSATLPSTAC